MDEVASVITAWEEKVLELWDEKLNLANDDHIVEQLYLRSSGLVQPLYKYLEQIAIAQLRHTLNSDLEEDIDIGEVLGLTRTARVNL